MTFAHPLLLWLLLLPLIMVGYQWRNTAKRISLLLKALSFGAILLAFAEPTLVTPERRTGVVVLVDTSGSITSGDLSRESKIADDIVRHRGRNWTKVVPFALQTRTLTPEELSDGLRLASSPGNERGATNFEAALTGSLAFIPGDRIPRIVLISDGNENEGSAARAIAELRSLKIPVDAIPLPGRPQTGLRITAVQMPAKAYAGEQIPIDLTINSPTNTQGTLAIAAGKKKLGASRLDLHRGINNVRVDTRVRSTGVTSITGRVAADNLGEVFFREALTLRRATVLYISSDPPGTESNLLEAFKDAEFGVTRDVSLIDKGLSGVQLVVLNNLDLNLLTTRQKDQLEKYVKDGGGLLLIGGERQVYRGDRPEDALDRALPATLAPPKTPKGTCVALIIDKSSSMEGRKIELARLSAIGVVDHLRPTDTIGVLMFDNSYQWAVPLRRALDKSLINRLISSIVPDGGTQIAPALAEAYRNVLPSKSTNKHIVLLTDGISEEGDSIQLAKDAAAHGVTISTVGLGQDVNRTYLEKIATASGGRSYFLNEPQGLEEILLKDVQDYSGSTAIERPLTPIVVSKAEILDGIDMNAAPPLKGYARFTAKPQSDTILAIDQVKKDPLYVSWQYGLGRAGVFTSDAKSRWAQGWIGWPGFDRFWINVSRDLLRHVDASEASIRFDSANEDLVVTYRLGPEVEEPSEIPAIFAMGSNGFQKQIVMQKLTSRVYRGRVYIGRATGLFRIRPVADSAAFPEVGLYRQQEELEDYGSNKPLLRQIADLTGGRFNPNPDSVFGSDGRSLSTRWQLWPSLLALAIVLTIIELIVRKWSGLVQIFNLKFLTNVRRSRSGMFAEIDRPTPDDRSGIEEQVSSDREPTLPHHS